MRIKVNNAAANQLFPSLRIGFAFAVLSTAVVFGHHGIVSIRDPTDPTHERNVFLASDIRYVVVDLAFVHQLDGSRIELMLKSCSQALLSYLIELFQQKSKKLDSCLAVLLTFSGLFRSVLPFAWRK